MSVLCKYIFFVKYFYWQNGPGCISFIDLSTRRNIEQTPYLVKRKLNFNNSFPTFEHVVRRRLSLRSFLISNRERVVKRKLTISQSFPNFEIKTFAEEKVKLAILTRFLFRFRFRTLISFIRIRPRFLT